MKIHFDNVQFGRGTGPSTFGTQLAQALVSLGHQVSTTSNGAEISLVFIEPSGAQLCEMVVQRIDGIWMKPGEFEHHNTRIRQLHSSADHVIYQSKFDKHYIQSNWGEPVAGTVVHNGTGHPVCSEVKNAGIQQLRSNYDKIFVCSSNWHPQKRLRTNIKLFSQFAEQHKNSCLIVMGSNPDCLVKMPNVYYTGPVLPEVYNEIYAVSNWMIHLAFMDHCPNVVIESMRQGTPVICASSGGTKEIVNEFGLVVKDVDDITGPTDYDNPPDIDLSNVQLPDTSKLGKCVDIDIYNVAKQYVSVFENTLST